MKLLDQVKELETRIKGSWVAAAYEDQINDLKVLAEKWDQEKDDLALMMYSKKMNQLQQMVKLKQVSKKITIEVE